MTEDNADASESSDQTDRATVSGMQPIVVYGRVTNHVDPAFESWAKEFAAESHLVEELLWTGLQEEAKEACDLLLDRNPREPGALILGGRVYARLNQHERAVELLRQVYTLERPRRFGSSLDCANLTELGESLLAVDEVDQAMDTFHEALLRGRFSLGVDRTLPSMEGSNLLSLRYNAHLAAAINWFFVAAIGHDFHSEREARMCVKIAPDAPGGQIMLAEILSDQKTDEKSAEARELWKKLINSKEESVRVIGRHFAPEHLTRELG